MVKKHFTLAFVLLLTAAWGQDSALKNSPTYVTLSPKACSATLNPNTCVYLQGPVFQEQIFSWSRHDELQFQQQQKMAEDVQRGFDQANAELNRDGTGGRAGGASGSMTPGVAWLGTRAFMMIAPDVGRGFGQFLFRNAGQAAGAVTNVEALSNIEHPIAKLNQWRDLPHPGWGKMGKVPGNHLARELENIWRGNPTLAISRVSGHAQLAQAVSKKSVLEILRTWELGEEPLQNIMLRDPAVVDYFQGMAEYTGRTGYAVELGGEADYLVDGLYFNVR